MNKIRTKIINGLEELRKNNKFLSVKLFDEERRLWVCIKDNLKDYGHNFQNYGQGSSEEKVKKLTKFITIYDYLCDLRLNINSSKRNFERIKYLINEE